MAFRILAIDGGGVRGIFPAHILASLAKQLGKLSGLFDLVAGTSVGAIVAAAIARDVDLDRLCTLYEAEAAAIFSRRVGSVRGVVRSAYSSVALQKLLTDVFGEATFAEVPGRLVVVATDVSNGTVFLMKSSYLSSFVRDGDIRLKDGILASCAAPGYFDPVRVKEYLLADGGLWGNNPSLIAYTEAVGKLGIKAEEVRILSLGTGTGHQYYDVGRAEQSFWGLASGWGGVKLINTVFNLQATSASNMARLLLGRRYLRISFDETGPLSLSEPRQIPRIRAKAAETFASQLQAVRQFLEL
jgi:hypothetical protein